MCLQITPFRNISNKIEMIKFKLLAFSCVLSTTIFAQLPNLDNLNESRPCWENMKFYFAKQDPTINQLVRDSVMLKDWVFGQNESAFTEIMDLHGKKWSPQDFAGKIVVLNFWFIGCKPCMAEIPAIHKLMDYYQDKKVVFLSSSVDDKDKITEWLKTNVLNIPIISKSYNRPDQCVLMGRPLNLVIDQNGALQYLKMGGSAGEKAETELFDNLTPLIDNLLKQN
jgi:thiol-disulfide isomerase/thioredoxin